MTALWVALHSIGQGHGRADVASLGACTSSLMICHVGVHLLVIVRSQKSHLFGFGKVVRGARVTLNVASLSITLCACRRNVVLNVSEIESKVRDATSG